MEKQKQIQIIETEEKSLLDMMAESYVPEVVSERKVIEAVEEDLGIKINIKRLDELLGDEDLQEDPEARAGRDICAICWCWGCDCQEARAEVE